jgi:hypothetical protein
MGNGHFHSLVTFHMRMANSGWSFLISQVAASSILAVDHNRMRVRHGNAFRRSPAGKRVTTPAA